MKANPTILSTSSGMPSITSITQPKTNLSISAFLMSYYNVIPLISLSFPSRNLRML